MGLHGWVNDEICHVWVNYPFNDTKNKSVLNKINEIACVKLILRALVATRTHRAKQRSVKPLNRQCHTQSLNNWSQWGILTVLLYWFTFLHFIDTFATKQGNILIYATNVHFNNLTQMIEWVCGYVGIMLGSVLTWIHLKPKRVDPIRRNTGIYSAFSGDGLL